MLFMSNNVSLSSYPLLINGLNHVQRPHVVNVARVRPRRQQRLPAVHGQTARVKSVQRFV